MNLSVSGHIFLVYICENCIYVKFACNSFPYSPDIFCYFRIVFEIINSLGEAPGVQFSNMGASPGETRVDSRNQTRAAALTTERLATLPTTRSLLQNCWIPERYTLL
jgi:hypothetical protein